MKYFITFIIIMSIQTYVKAQLRLGTSERFPSELIDTSLVSSRGQMDLFKLLTKNCNWKTKIGERIDVFWLVANGKNYFGHVYEYFFDCDNLRLIFWFEDPNGMGKVVDFMIENLEDDSAYVSSKVKYLKNKRPYKKLLSE